MNEIIQEEKWKKVNGYKNYEVSTFGNVRNTKTGRILKPTPSQSGYTVVSLSKKGEGIRSYSIARLVMDAFNPPEMENQVIYYKDKDKTNCRLDNLVYGNKQWRNTPQIRFRQLKINLTSTINAYIEEWSKDPDKENISDLKNNLIHMIDFWEECHKPLGHTDEDTDYKYIFNDNNEELDM